MTSHAKKFNAQSWLTNQGYAVDMNHITHIHTLSKDNACVTIQGKWPTWENYLSKKFVQCMLYQMHYVSELNPALQFNLASRDNWNALILQTQIAWLAHPANLLQRLLECAQDVPQAHEWSFTPDPTDTSKTDVALKYYLADGHNGTPVKLYIKAIVPSNDPPIARLTASEILDLSGIPESVESLLGETWSDEWWSAVRTINMSSKQKASLGSYALPDNTELGP